LRLASRHFPDRASLSFYYYSVVASLELFTYRLILCVAALRSDSRQNKLKGLHTSHLPFEARYNIAPSQSVVASATRKRLEIEDLTWGLIPSWSAEAKAFINARAETLEDKPSFSDCFDCADV